MLAPAWSAPAILMFKNPTGIATDTDSIEVWLTLALDTASDPLITDSSGLVTPLPRLADIAANLFSGLPAGVNENSATSASLNVSVGCSGSFSSNCSGTPYDFNFNFAPPSFAGARSLNLQPGSVTDFLLGTFTPCSGRVPAGTYTFPFAAFFIQVYDDTRLDPVFPNSPLHIAYIPIADTASQQPFTRMVFDADEVITPEPGTYGCILAGFVVLGLKRARAGR